MQERLSHTTNMRPGALWSRGSSTDTAPLVTGFYYAGAAPKWEAGSRLSACGAGGGTGDRPDVGEHAAGVPGWEGSY
jgi:hypothetical protein